ncbi:MAG: hypothetical protein BGO12_19605 [Verrucomicrobia bacterium 61-8]|nr:DegT/DnrJ/EryC1/StrS family aminotransferase [Verrucomicrobiota bacterium]OJV08323.1 MAG: hypothetical protein BGO12_19605 [Verrucomicrobia bacterium 61-8]
MSELSLVLPANPAASYQAHREEFDAALQAALGGTNYILGENVSAFEREYAAWMGGGQAIGVANGTDAVELCLRACGVQPGDLVALPTHTAVATATAVVRAGAKPVFLDINPETFLLDLASLGKVLVSEKKLAAVVAVHLYGQAVDMTTLMAWAGTYGFQVVEDCSQAHGALWEGRKVGWFGHAAAYSCYPTKNLGAIGDAGIAFTASPDIAERILSLRQYGWRERYISSEVGMNSRLDELQAAILRVKLRYLDADNARRRAIASQYDAAFSSLEILRPSVHEGHVFHQYTIATERRDDLKDSLAERKVVAGILYPQPIHRQSAYYEYVDESTVDLSSAEEACRTLLCLPMHPHLSDEDVARVSDGVVSFFA